MFTEEQFEALDKAKTLMAGMRFQPPPTEDMVANGKVYKFGFKPFQNGFLVTIEVAKQMQVFLKSQFGIPTLLVYYLSQDELERTFSIVRELGGGTNLHPSPLEYLQRLCQYVLMLLMDYKTFDIMAMQARLKVFENLSTEL